jgi:hypothetical protein
MPEFRGAESFYSRMFVEDVMNSVVPVGGYVGDREPAVILKTTNGADSVMLEALVASGFSYGQHYSDRREPHEAVCEWISQAVGELMREGAGWYEVAFVETPEHKRVGFAVVPIYSGEVVRRFGLGPVVQRIPAGSRLPGRGFTQVDTVKTEYVALDKNRLVKIVPPRHLRHVYRAVLEMAPIGENMHGELMMASVTRRSDVPFDFQVFRATQEKAVAQASRKAGWNARSSFGEYQTEYYATYRRLGFERMLCEFRALMLAAANKMLALVGPELGVSCTLEFRGIPTRSDIAEAEALLERGDIDVKDLLKRFSLY